MHAKSKSPLTVFTRAIERWENEGGRVAGFGRKRTPTSDPFLSSQRPRAGGDFDAQGSSRPGRQQRVKLRSPLDSKAEDCR
jgi:hypothetical protein